jgi:hypothetical protein
LGSSQHLRRTDIASGSTSKSTQCLRGPLIRGKEGLYGKLGKCNVHRRTEHRRRAEEGEHAGVRDKAERYGHRGRIAINLLRLIRRRIVAQLAQQPDQDGIAADVDLTPQTRQKMLPPSPRLAVRGASPCEWRLRRSTATGGRSSEGSVPAGRRRVAELDAMSVQ